MLTASSVLSCSKNPVHKMRYGRLFTACEPEQQRVVRKVMHRSIRRFFTGPSPAFARACQSMRVVRRTRSRMTACPRSYDLLLHRLVSDFSTELSPVHQPVLHNLSTGLSTGSTSPSRRRRGNPRLISRLDGERQRSVDTGVGISKTPGCLRWVQGEDQSLARRFDYNSSAVKVNL